METVTLTETGCYLDNHRGHYIGRDTIQLAQGWGFIVGPFEQWAIDTYEQAPYLAADPKEYPFEAMTELCEEAIAWLNSGQDDCDKCGGTGHPPEGRDEWYTHKDRPDVKLCRPCSGTGQGPRIGGQNLPPKVPKDYYWSFNDGDFGLYPIEEQEDE